MKFEEVIQSCHWIKEVGENHYEMVLDNHMLASFRSCEQYFQHSMVEGWGSKSKKTHWFFAIGILVHKFIEDYYQMKELQTLDYQVLIAHAVKQWQEYEMDALYSDEKGYKELGGLPGYCTLVSQYANFYDGDVERLRPIATEISFGKEKEVFLGSFLMPSVDATTEELLENDEFDLNKMRVDCYLAGRIDLMMDNGKMLGPMDHKTSGYIKPNPLDGYDPSDGLTGYIFATREIVKKNFPELLLQRKLNMMWVNFIGITSQPDSNKRFKRIPLHKTDWQLEQYRLRQVATFRRIFEMLYFEEEPQWNTSACSNMYRRDCAFKAVHRQGDLNAAFLIMNNSFERGKIWNTQDMEE